MSTIAQVISRVRGQVKAEVQDAFITDRYIYSLIRKACSVFNEKTRLCK